MFEWLNRQLSSIGSWCQLKFRNFWAWMQASFNYSATTSAHPDKSAQANPAPSETDIHKMSAKRRWQWLRNLIFLKKWSSNKSTLMIIDSAIVSRFSNKQALLVGTDLSFERNPLPIAAADEFINTAAFEEYLGYLAHYKNYHLFANVLISMLRKNSISTIELLKNLLHACEQLESQSFFQGNYTLLYLKDKSQQWIGSLMYRIMPKEPLEIRKLDDARQSQSYNFLLCDDICYTGTQATRYLDKIIDDLYLVNKTEKKVHITLLFGRLSIYALAILNKHINYIYKHKRSNGFIEKEQGRNLEIKIVAGVLFNTLSVQLDSLPFRTSLQEKSIITQLLEANYSSAYSNGDLRKVPLLTTAWKKPDYVSSYHRFVGYEASGPDTILISSVLLTQPPNRPIAFFSVDNPAPNTKVLEAFISGPKPPYKQ